MTKDYSISEKIDRLYYVTYWKDAVYLTAWKLKALLQPPDQIVPQVSWGRSSLYRRQEMTEKIIAAKQLLSAFDGFYR